MDISQPKKSLGQHFFNNKNLALIIVDQVLRSEPAYLLEIGPGTGVFTHLFSKTGVKIVAIEKDSDKFTLLHMVESLKDVEFYNSDILDMSNSDLAKIFPDQIDAVVFGSLPYNSSKRIVTHLIKNTVIKDFYYIIQKEVAEKYVGSDGSNRLSIITGAYAETRILKKISPSNFNPRPKVDSALIHIDRRGNPLITTADSENYEKFVQLAFSNPRKKLSNNLERLLNNKAMVTEMKRDDPILQKRASQLDVHQFVSLFELLNKRVDTSDIIPADEERE